jgi:hypothetical protein
MRSGGKEIHLVILVELVCTNDLVTHMPLKKKNVKINNTSLRHVGLKLT